MSFLKFFGLGPAKPASAPDSRLAAEPSMSTQSQTDIQRELIRVVLKATLRQHGIPTEWIGSDVTVIGRRSGGKKAFFVHLIVQEWNQALLNFAPELQNQLLLALDQFEPKVDHSNYIVSWRFDPQPAGQVGMGVRHVDRGALVAHVDDADAFGVQPHPDRHDVPAAQPEHPVYAALFEKPRNHRCGCMFRRLFR